MADRVYSTEEILALRRTGCAIDERFVAWALDALEQGHDSPGLRILVGETAPFQPFSMQALVDRTFRELGLHVVPDLEQAMTVLARRIARSVLAGEAGRGEALGELRDYHEQFAVRVLRDFYLLSHAFDDLQSDPQQWYWPGADRDNIERIVDERFRALLDDAR